jgi:8-oxo-dGTP diphosphatase
MSNKLNGSESSLQAVPSLLTEFIRAKDRSLPQSHGNCNAARTPQIRLPPERPSLFLNPHMPKSSLPYKISTLLYCFNRENQVLLLERAQEPNLGLWSPCGGKLRTDTGESPYACACREAAEELGWHLQPSDLHLTGMVSEHGYQGQNHWLMFLFEALPKLDFLPPPHREGRFQFFARAAVSSLNVPQTDAERIWPWFWQHRGGFFAAHCHCHPDGRNDWTLEESNGLHPPG